MNEMDMNNRDYRNYRNYRDDDMDYDYMGYDNRNYRDNYRRDYDRRGGRINNRYRNYRNYREEDYYEELEMTMHEMKETSRKLEDVADMAENQQDKNMLMKIAQKEKENSHYIKQLVEK